MHTVAAGYTVAASFVLGISAWYLLHGRHQEFARRSFTGGLLLATLVPLGSSAANTLDAYRRDLDDLAETVGDPLAADEPALRLWLARQAHSADTTPA